MFSTKTKAKSVKRRKNTKSRNPLKKINFQSRKVQLLVTVLIFSIMGGGYYVYNTFAATNYYQAVTASPSFSACRSSGIFTKGGKAAIAVYRPSNATFYIDNDQNGIADKTVRFGDPNSDIPCVGDYNNDGADDVAIYRPSNSTWYIDTNLDGLADKIFPFGDPGDIPFLSGRITGPTSGFGGKETNSASPGQFRPSKDERQGSNVFDAALVLPDGINNVASPINYVSIGGIGHAPFIKKPTTMVLDTNKPFKNGGDGTTFPIYYEKATAIWSDLPDKPNAAIGYNGWKTMMFGKSGDLPIISDFNGDGFNDLAVYRPSNSTFYVDTDFNGTTDITRSFGNPGDIPVPGNYSGNTNGQSNFAVYRPSNSTFYIDINNNGRADLTKRFGDPGDIPIARR